MNEEMRSPDQGQCVGIAPQPLMSQKHDVNIVQAENGFIVRVGCKVFVFSDWVLANEALALYFKNPEEAYKKYVKC